MEHTLWKTYESAGLRIWGIAPDDAYGTLTTFSDEMGLSFPILYDEGGVVHDAYNAGSKTTNSIYPQDWIIGGDGAVLYVNTAYDPEQMIAVIEAELQRLNDLP